ncbi:MAG: molybdopterin-dependent oxidoreductase [Paracoccaceae bacterium]
MDISGAVKTETVFSANDIGALPAAEMISDFHYASCGTLRGLRWGGYAFDDLWARLIEPRTRPEDRARFVVVHGSDGYRASFRLDDLLDGKAFLATSLDGEALDGERGGPWRLIVPALYGHKSVKAVCRVELCRDLAGYRPMGARFLDHPRARVALEERARWVPGVILRFPLRALSRPVRRMAGGLSRLRQI